MECVDEALVPIYRAMTSAQRVVAGLSATDMIRDRLTATVSELHPAWTDDAIASEVSRRMLRARD